MRAIPENPQAADITFWEVEYTDGTSWSEDQITYSQIDRSKVAKFRLIKGVETIFEMVPPPGFSGQNLVYRRRTAMSATDGSRNVLLILGWAPNGPVFAVDVRNGSYRVLEDGFLVGDPDLYPPVAFPGEPDLF